MKVILENTSKTVLLKKPGGGHMRVAARIWEGKTDTGVPVVCFITRIEAPDDVDVEQFKRELAEVRQPSADVKALPRNLELPA